MDSGEKIVSKEMPSDILGFLESVDYDANSPAEIDRLLALMRDMLLPGLPCYTKEEKLPARRLKTTVPQRVLNVFNRIKYPDIPQMKAFALRQALPGYIKGNLKTVQ